MSFVIDYVQYTPWYDTFVGVSGTVSPPSNWHVIIPSSVTNSGTVYTVKTLFSAVFIHLTNLISIEIKYMASPNKTKVTNKTANFSDGRIFLQIG